MPEQRTTHTWTIAGMVLTLLLSFGASYVTGLTNDAAMEVKLTELSQDIDKVDIIENKVFTIVSEIKHLTRVDTEHSLYIGKNRDRISKAEVTGAETRQAITDLVDATNRLAGTTNDLIIAVGRLQGKVD